MKKAVYPGSFDPITIGHLDIIRRAAAYFDELTVAVLHNLSKSSLFSVEERVKMIEEAVKDIPNVKVDSFSGLLVDYCKDRDINVSVRGLRTAADFNYELPVAQFNDRLSDGDLETFFLASKAEFVPISSSAVREIAGFYGKLKGLVPDEILNILYEKYNYPIEKRI